MDMYRTIDIENTFPWDNKKHFKVQGHRSSLQTAMHCNKMPCTSEKHNTDGKLTSSECILIITKNDDKT
jgi:hypothetical protein